jgi:FHA domain
MGTDMARKGAAYVMAAALAVVLWGGYIGGWQWTGFRGNKQLWDWLTLLLLPVVLGTIPLWIQAKDYIGKGRRTLYAVIIVAWAGFMIAGYLVPLTWTGFADQKLWNWLDLLVLPAVVVTTTTLMSMRGRRPKGWLRPHQKAIIAALAAGWIVTVIGGYALGWKWTGYAGRTFWDWLQEFLPLVFPIILLPPLVRWVTGNSAGRARASHEATLAPTAAGKAAGHPSVAQEAAVARTAAGGGVWVNESVNRLGLWSVPGNGVLARQGDLILLSAIDERGLVEKLLDSLVKTSRGGGDGRRFTDAVEDLIESDVTWGGAHEGQLEPAVIAIGPVGAGIAVIVSGTAWAEIATVQGTDRLVAGQPATVRRGVVGVPVHAVRGGLGTGRDVGDRTDRFSRLERGTVRAGGLSYHCGLPAAPPQGAASAAMAPLVHDAAAPDGASPVSAADAGAAASGPTAEEAAGARQRPYPAEPPPPMQPDAVELHEIEPEMAEPEAADVGTAEPGSAKPVAVEPAAPPQAGPVHPATEKIQVPDFGAASAAAPPDAAVPAHQATGPGPAEVPPLPPVGAPNDGTGAAADAPVVLDMYCENHHFGDPEARSCAVCGVSKNRPGSIPEPGPRPPLGALVLDDDSILELNADCVVGRDPALDPSVAAGHARPLRIIDAQVSRIHARVHLDGWQVSLIDLGSTNGTRIRPPGKRSDQALEPNVPVPLQSGTRVFMGTQGFQYEYNRGR